MLMLAPAGGAPWLLSVFANGRPMRITFVHSFISQIGGSNSPP
jgi:hypothetical protein